MNDHLHALPAGHRLGGYRIERVLGDGGFGITYYARDIDIGKQVAIKEYFPSDFAVRTDGATVKPKSTDDQETYQWGLERALDEARALAHFKHPHINEVYRLFEDNGTAYIVLEYVEGETLEQLLQREGQLDAVPLRRLLEELLSGLEKVHQAGFVHRDIKPENIMLRENGDAVLLDFGAARQAVGRRLKRITSIRTPGYAPIEQYSSKGEDIGPWTDFYALGMVAYRCISGIDVVPEAVERALPTHKDEQSKDLTPAVEVARGRYDASLLKAVDWAIQVHKEQRPQNVAAMREALIGGDESDETASDAAQSSGVSDAVAQSPPNSAEDAADSEKDRVVRTPLHSAARENAHETAKLLISHRANVHAKSKDGDTPLHDAARENAHETAKLLISRGADVHAKDKYGDTPLHVAARYNARKTAKLLISRGADVHAKSKDGDTPLHVAARIFARKIVKEWISLGAVHVENKNAPKTVKLLISLGADVHAKSKDGDTPLHDAAWDNERKTAKLLISRGADVHAKRKDGSTPLHHAAWKNARKTAKLLISRGADVHAKRKDGDTPLHGAARNNAHETAKLLISRGADVHAKRKDGDTPLHDAARENARKTVKLLISHRANVHAKSKDGDTPLHDAAGENAHEIAKLLISRGADVHAKSKDGDTPLHDAAGENAHETAKLLISLGADVHAKDKDGDTPLHDAAWTNAHETAKLLISHGANVQVENKNGSTPQALAAEAGHLEMSRWLQRSASAATGG